MTVRREQIVGALQAAEGRADALATGALAVEPIDSQGIFMAAADREGSWALAIRSRPTRAHVPGVRLAMLSAEYGVRCNLDLAGATGSVRVSLVRCRTNDAALRNLFASFVAALLDELPPDPTEQAIADVIQSWVSLFWRLQSPPRTDVVGLIGELVVLDSAANTALWVAAWHNSPLDAIDFGFTDPRMEIEVKATTGRERIHTLSIHQSNSFGAERYFASLVVELRDTGASVGDLAQGIADRLAGEDERRQFWTAIADACGEQFGDYLATCFILEVSRNTLAFYPAEDVPAPVVEMPLPVGVSDLRFRSDFSSVTSVDAVPILGRST